MMTVGRLTMRALVALVGCSVGVLAVITFLLPRAVGGESLTVLTGSMTPGIPVGSLVVTRPVDPAMLEVGDVITFSEPDEVTGRTELVTHRIVRIRNTQPLSFVTKGDANAAADLEPVFGPNIQGQLWYHVPHVGNAQRLIAGGPGGAVALGVLGLGGYALFQAWGVLRDRRSSRRTPGGRAEVLVLTSLPHEDHDGPLAEARRAFIDAGLVLTDGPDQVDVLTAVSAEDKDDLVEEVRRLRPSRIAVCSSPCFDPLDLSPITTADAAPAPTTSDGTAVRVDAPA